MEPVVEAELEGPSRADEAASIVALVVASVVFVHAATSNWGMGALLYAPGALFAAMVCLAIASAKLIRTRSWRNAVKPAAFWGAAALIFALAAFLGMHGASGC